MTAGSEAILSTYIEAMTSRIVRQFHPLRIILFGSHARGEAGAESDVDLLVVLPDATDRRQAAIAIRRALSEGRLLYERN